VGLRKQILPRGKKRTERDERLDEVILDALRQVKGIVKAAAIPEEDRQQTLNVEEDTEARSLMGLGKVINVRILFPDKRGLS